MSGVLLIGGSDGSCGAGVFADYETLKSLGSPGKVIITSVTSQNDSIYLGSYDLPFISLKSQLEAVSLADFNVVKIGMLPTVECVEVVSRYLDDISLQVGLDPLMQSASGGILNSPETTLAMEKLLLPRVCLFTPNLLEARSLLKLGKDQKMAMEEMATRVLQLGSESVLLKGGHGDGTICRDILVGKVKEPIFYERNKIEGATSLRGTGCRLATAIAHFLAHGMRLEDSVMEGIEFLQEYIRKNRKN